MPQRDLRFIEMRCKGKKKKVEIKEKSPQFGVESDFSC
jgi:hypothetical protein